MARNENHASVPTCVIFNPAARGNKARHFRQHLDEIGGQSALKATAAPGDARRLATEAVGDGYDLIVAAGGDGTVNEVLNGIGDAPDGFARAARPFIAFCPGVQKCSGFRHSQTAGFVHRPFAREQLLTHRTHPTETHLRRIGQFHNLPQT